ncbi:hypothetical protein [Brevundimonas sp. UBA5936]|jgi:hypothetical protein|nr:hypothetical protein [Brevundimonas sp. UBA5936]
MARVAPTRIQQVIIVVITMFAVRALLGEEIAGFTDGLVLGFTDGV